MKRLQYKLVQMLLLTSTLPLIVLSIITVFSLERIAIEDAKQRLNHYLNMVQPIFDSVSSDLKYTVRDQNRKIYTLLENNQLDLLREELGKTLKEQRLDFFIITDKNAAIIISVNNPQAAGEILDHSYFLTKSLSSETFVSTEVFDEEILKELGLISKAKVIGLKKPQGLVMLASLPVLNRKDEIVATMTAGYLINNNNKIIVDEIGKRTGLVSSIFLDDIRICSNIPSKKGEYAVGSSLGLREVRESISKGHRYMGSMRIRGEGYIAGYMPLYNSGNNIIATLSIGIPEAYVFSLRDSLIKIFTIAVLLSIILALMFGLLRGGRIVNSIEKLREGTQAITRGDFLHKIHIYSKDEIEELANFFNKMTQELKIARKQVEDYSRSLEDKVKEKTSQLESVHKKLVEYERMAAMGRMAATLGHELRNIFAGIRTVTYNLKSKITKSCPDLLTPVKDLEYEVNYGNDILDNVLRFSLPKKLVLGDADVNAIIEEVVSSLNLEEVFKNTEVIKNLNNAIPKIKADSVQIKEVVINVVINATQAMPGGGKLTISTDNDSENLKIQISDTGSGITKKALDNLFVPFFTTKSRGLGLGLFIAKEIVKAHNGAIEVDTELNKGTTFTITLPFKNQRT